MMQPTDHRPRLAVDIGGTFTDLVLKTETGYRSTKVLTTHEAPELAVFEGMRDLLKQARIAADAVGLIIHGTTLATNALIERKGAKTALLMTEGFRDTLEMAFEHRFEQYDIYIEKTPALIPREGRYEVTERVASDGQVILPLDEAELDRVGKKMAKDGVEAVAVCFLHSYINPEHEQRARQILSRFFPERLISISSEVCPEIREYERASTTAANAYVLPIMESYLKRMQDGLRQMGCSAPLLLMMSSGGITTAETARRFPIRLVESGPAGGAIMALDVAAQNGHAKAIAFDMGGTTAKVTLIDDLRPQRSRNFEIARASRFVKGSGIPVQIPVIDMVEIGAGGGSIARLDALLRIAVGPDSAGSMPGPCCYGRGGKLPTVTDADLLLGWIDAAKFAGGKIHLDVEAANEAVEANIAASTRMNHRSAAYGITEIVTETMASAARVHAVEKGKDMRGRVLIAFGGAAPLHAARMAQKLGVSRIVIPVGAGVGSAYGFLRAPISYEVVKTHLMRLDAFAPDQAASIFAAMREEARKVVDVALSPDAERREERVVYMRYRGQGHEIPVPVEDAALNVEGGGQLRDAFEKVYHQMYGRVIPDLEVEAITWSLQISEVRELPEAQPIPRKLYAPVAREYREMQDPGHSEWLSAAIYDRAELNEGAHIHGPAIVFEAETSTLVPAEFTATCNSVGHLILDRKAS